MKNLNSLLTKKVFLSILVLTTISIIAVVGYANKSENLMKIIGYQQKQIESKNDNIPIMKINGKIIDKKTFDGFKNLTNQGPNKVSDKELKDRIIERQLLYNEAVKNSPKLSTASNNVGGTPTLADKMIDDSKKGLKLDKEQYANFKEYIAGLGMTEDEYWNSVKPTYEKALFVGSYKNKLKKDFADKNNLKDPNEITAKFNEYYKNIYIQELKNNAKIEFAK